MVPARRLVFHDLGGLDMQNQCSPPQRLGGRLVAAVAGLVAPPGSFQMCHVRDQILDYTDTSTGPNLFSTARNFRPGVKP
jgi:hypothetical protein